MLKQRAETLGVHLILIAYCLLAVGPILLVVMNSFKARKAIFGAPLDGGGANRRGWAELSLRNERWPNHCPKSLPRCRARDSWL